MVPGKSFNSKVYATATRLQTPAAETKVSGFNTDRRPTTSSANPKKRKGDVVKNLANNLHQRKTREYEKYEKKKE